MTTRFLLSALAVLGLAVSDLVNAGEPPYVVLITGENEYHSEETLPVLARLLESQYGCRCSIASGQGDAGIGGLDALETADVAVMFVRRRTLPKAQLDKIRAYLDAGKPLVALRTCSHAFHILSGEAPAGTEQWPTFDRDVLGGSYHGHTKTVQDDSVHVQLHIAPDAAGDPILAGIDATKWLSKGTLYLTSPIDPQAKLLLTGSIGETAEPVAWTRTYHGGRIFYTSLGHASDFDVPQSRTLLINAIYWAMDRQVPRQ